MTLMRAEQWPIIIFICIIIIFACGVWFPPSKMGKIGQNVDKRIALEKLVSLTTGYSITPKEAFILHVFASWCNTCKQNHSMFEKLAGKTMVYGLIWHDDIINVQKAEQKIYNDILADNTNEVAISLGIKGVPETFLIDRDGKVLYGFRGVITEKVINNAILPTLEENRNFLPN